MERHGGDLEAEPDQQQGQPGEQHHTRLRHEADLHADQPDVCSAGRAIDQGDAIQQEPRRECAEQEVLERRLGGARAAPVEPREHIYGDRHELEPEEDHHEVRPRRHDHHPQRSEQQQHVVLGREQLFALQIEEGQQYGERRGSQEQPVGHPAEVVGGDHRRESFDLRVVPPQPPHDACRGYQGRQRQATRNTQIAHRLVPPGNEQQQHHRPNREHELGQQRNEQLVVERGIEAHCCPPPVGVPGRSCSISWRAVGSMRRRNGFG